MLRKYGTIVVFDLNVGVQWVLTGVEQLLVDPESIDEMQREMFRVFFFCFNCFFCCCTLSNFNREGHSLFKCC